MIPTKELNDVLLTHDLPPELRRAWTMHRSDDYRPSLMVTGVAGYEEQEEVISPYLLRQNLVVPAYPFRTSTTQLAQSC